MSRTEHHEQEGKVILGMQVDHGQVRAWCQRMDTAEARLLGGGIGRYHPRRVRASRFRTGPALAIARLVTDGALTMPRPAKKK